MSHNEELPWSSGCASACCTAGGSETNAPPRSSKFVCPCLEGFEERIALATFVGGDPFDPLGHWSNANNWLNGVQPANGDDVTLGADAANRPSTMDMVGLSLRTLQLNNAFGVGGFLNVQQNLTVTEMVRLWGGNMNVDVGATLTTKEFYHEFGRPLIGSGTVSIVGNFMAPGGFILRNTPATVGILGLVLDSSSTLLLSVDTEFVNTQVTNLGRTEWAGGNTTFRHVAQVTNYGTFDAAPGAGSSWGGTGNLRGKLINHGTFTKSGAGEVTVNSVYETFTFSGPTAVTGGDLTFTGGGDQWGPFVAAADTNMTFAEGLYRLYTGANFSGEGTVRVTGAGSWQVPQFHSASSTAKLVFDAAVNLHGTGSFSSHNYLTWNEGLVMDLAGLTVSGGLSLASNIDKTLQATVLRNEGYAEWKDAGNINLTGAMFENAGTFEIKNNQKIVGGTFRNLAGGTLMKTAGALTAIDAVFENAGSVQLLGRHIKFERDLTQSGGVIDLGNGILEALLSARLNGGVLRGGGEVRGDLFNSAGVVEVGDNPNNRTLKVTGNYTQAAQGLLQVFISPIVGGWAWGLLDITGSANLAGAVGFQVTAGTLPVGTSGTILKSGGRTGTLTPPADWTVTPVGNDLTARKD